MIARVVAEEILWAIYRRDAPFSLEIHARAASIARDVAWLSVWLFDRVLTSHRQDDAFGGWNCLRTFDFTNLCLLCYTCFWLFHHTCFLFAGHRQGDTRGGLSQRCPLLHTLRSLRNVPVSATPRCAIYRTMSISHSIPSLEKKSLDSC